MNIFKYRFSKTSFQEAYFFLYSHAKGNFVGEWALAKPSLISHLIFSEKFTSWSPPYPQGI